MKLKDKFTREYGEQQLKDIKKFLKDIFNDNEDDAPEDIYFKGQLRNKLFVTFATVVITGISFLVFPIEVGRVLLLLFALELYNLFYTVHIFRNHKWVRINEATVLSCGYGDTKSFGGTMAAADNYMHKTLEMNFYDNFTGIIYNVPLRKQYGILEKGTQISIVIPDKYIDTGKYRMLNRFYLLNILKLGGTKEN